MTEEQMRLQLQQIKHNLKTTEWTIQRQRESLAWLEQTAQEQRLEIQRLERALSVHVKPTEKPSNEDEGWTL
jgi:hypothetical protein